MSKCFRNFGYDFCEKIKLDSAQLELEIGLNLVKIHNIILLVNSLNDQYREKRKKSIKNLIGRSRLSAYI